MRWNLSPVLLGPLFAGALACTSADGGTPPVAQPARLVLATAPAASAANGSPLAPQPVVQVVDLAGAPLDVRGILVTASIASGASALEGTLEVRTGANGQAVFTDLVLRGATGPRTLRFSAAGLSAVVSSPIQLEAGSAAQAVINAGNNQTAPAGTAVPVAPQVKVVDQTDNPVVGVRVTFEVTQGGGSLTGADVITGADGTATLGQWTLGTAVGANVLRASVAGLATSLVFSATAIVGPAALLVPVEGDGQQVALGAQVPTAPAVRVTDIAGNTIAGVTVTFAVASGGGSITGAAAISNASGVARVGSWRLGLVQGEQSLTATRSGTSQAAFIATALGFPASALSLGGGHSCALTSDGLRCWGDNSVAQFGNGTDIGDSIPTAAGGTLSFTSISAGGGHTCGLTAAGAAWCWGNNTSGQLGDGTGVSRLSPVPVAGGFSFRAISAGLNHTCALRTDGAAYCWGQGGNGRLGNGATTTTPVPVPVAGGFTWASIHAGGAHTCARRNDDAIYCWGSNANGRLGDATTTDRSTPTPLSGGGAWTALAVGGAHTCALKAGGQAFCWGLGSSGQLGVGGTPSQVSVPTGVAGATTFSALVAAEASTCGLTADGVAWCWGNNGNGRLGDGTTTNRAAPTLVAGNARFASLALGSQHSCGRLLSEAVVCWGRNAEGQVGDATTTARLSPVGVRRP